ncbi:branched-chain amino acid transport system substrate-binding protein [Xanthobacter flavus]|uniref:Branched-chain amino acid ABC transporter substrate-binding protein n=1 Tax=Xanthobacter flavus TaxID=281 RepID=A0A9W6CIL9_XANFL|nr:ABC transporter substrate-binding protein [Xanthobacter flavus]MDR6334375.1 branched-chain amino acid transport system substrate-binding protein [Xanthobacter flavus]GLI23096.1 branched-chain amino acid ABC transporter substrate-binding protein [Xanthobacter flavus]
MKPTTGIDRRGLLKGAAGLAATSALGAFPMPALAQNTPLKIGIIAPRAGTAAYIGENGLRSAEWTAKKINEAGGIAGRKIELVVEEETNAKETLERARRLVLQEKVDCIQGGYSTGVTLPMAPTLEDMQVLTIFWDGTTQDGVKETMPSPKFVFKSTDNECEAVMASLIAAKHLKGQFKRIAAISPDYTYGRNVWTAFKALNKKFGIDAEVVSEQWSSFSQLDFTSNVAALKAAKPDLIYCVLGNADLPIFMRAATSAGLTDTARMVLVQAGHQHGQLKKPFTPVGTLLCYNTMYFAKPNPSAAQKEFVDYYMDRFKDYPHWECERAYFAMNLYKGGVEKVVAAKGGSWPKPEEVAQAMEGITFESFGGPAAMRKDHIAEEVFYGGFGTHDNPYDVSTLQTPYSYPASVLQKPPGADFWGWLETATFPV